MRKIQVSSFALAVTTLSAFVSTEVMGATPDYAGCYAQQTMKEPFSGVVLVSDGKIKFFKAVGTLDGRKPVTRADQFQLASVGKVLTRVAIGLLVAKGKIDLDAPIGRYLPQLPPAMAGVTTDQLLQHRSGITAAMFFNPDSMAIIRDAKTARDLLPLVVSEPLSFAPGTREEYSNGGYFVLGAIIEAVSGQAYPIYMRDNVFAPLGMSATSLDHGPNLAAPMSRMGGPGDPPLTKAKPFTLMAVPHGNPAGDAVSTIDDLAKLAGALTGDALLPAPIKSRIFPKRSDPWLLGQAGGAPGRNSYFAVIPAQATTIITLSNYDPPAAELLGSVLAALAKSGTCKPMSAADRPSATRIVHPPLAPGTPHQ